jgi:hypothetical protein
MNKVSSEQPSNTDSSRTPSIGSDIFSNSPAGYDIDAVFQGLTVTTDTKNEREKSPPSSRRQIDSEPPSLSPDSPLISAGSKTDIIPHILFPSKDSIPLTIPPCPDLVLPPYVNAVGPVFEGEEWNPLVDRLDDKVIKNLVACEYLAKALNLPVQKLQRTGLHYNIMALDEKTIVEITRDCWYIMYEIIADGLGWTELLDRKRSLFERLKRNLRQSQPRARWDIPCDALLSLGFTESWLYE